MRHARPLVFDNLEPRKLLSKVHHPAPHIDPLPTTSPVAAVAPLALDGTLTANNKAATIITDGYGDQTTAIPVSGVIAGVGMVHGTWDESADAQQQYLGPDSIQLHNSKGSFVLGFDATTLGQSEQTAQGTIYPGASVQLSDGTGAYTDLPASGFLQETTNPRGTVVESLTLSSAKPG